MRLRIIIDNQDAADAPESPFTLNVYRDGDDGTESRNSKEFDDGSGCLIGSDLAVMLRQLADEIENRTVGEPDEFDLCSTCGDWNDDGEGSNGLCGNCADRATCKECGEAFDAEDLEPYGMCASCWHDALRSGWIPGASA